MLKQTKSYNMFNIMLESDTNL